MKTALIWLFIFAGIGVSEPSPLPLLERQREIAEHFAQIEPILLRMAEVVAVTNPRQSALLKKVHRESRDRLVAMNLDGTTAALQSRRFAETVAAQQQILDDLAALVRLLESDNRAQKRDAEQSRNREMLRRLDDILQRQRSLRAQTDRHDTTAPTAPLAASQQELREQTESLAEKMSETRDTTPPTETPSTSTPSQPLERAGRAMRAAESQLRDEARAAAIASQNDAIAALQRAKESLEKSLQQLREEEAIEQLQWLTTRLQTMLRLERLVQSDFAALTASAAENSPPDDERTWRLKCARLAGDQGNVVAEANAAILVLREDGRAQAMTESLSQVASDMVLVRDRLTRGQLDSTTRQLIDSVITAFEEMIAAAEQSRREQQNADAPSPSDSDTASPLGEERRELLSLLAELKMIQTMQRRITERTKLCESMRHDPETPPDQIAAYLDDLARQQATIVRMLENIKAGKHL